MGCVVNGPGESKHANIGISLPGTFEEPKAPVYVDGRLLVTLKGDRIVPEFLEILDEYVASRYGAAGPSAALTCYFAAVPLVLQAAIETTLRHQPLAALPLLFGAGLATSLTPCVYPMIPDHGRNPGRCRRDRWLTGGARVLTHGHYVVGLALVYALLGLLAGLTGSLFGAISSSPWAYFLMGNLLLVFGLALLGRLYVEVPRQDSPAGPAELGASSPGGVFAMGATSGLVAAPCGAPAFAAVLTFVAATGSALLGFVYLSSSRSGLTALLVVVGLSSGAACRAAPSREVDPLGQVVPEACCSCWEWRSTTSFGWGLSCEKRLRRSHLSCWPRRWARRPPAQEDGHRRRIAKAPVVTVHDLDGKPVDLGQYHRQEAGASSSGGPPGASSVSSCLPRLEAARAEVGDAVEFIGVNVAVNQSPERVRRYLREHSGPVPDAVRRPRAPAPGPTGAPSTSYVVIVDRAGKVAYTGVGGDQDFNERAPPGRRPVITLCTRFAGHVCATDLTFAVLLLAACSCVDRAGGPEGPTDGGPERRAAGRASRAPDFTLPWANKDGVGPAESPYQLWRDRGKTVVIAFYPRDFTTDAPRRCRPSPTSTTRCSGPTSRSWASTRDSCTTPQSVCRPAGSCRSGS